MVQGIVERQAGSMTQMGHAAFRSLAIHEYKDTAADHVGRPKRVL